MPIDFTCPECREAIRVHEALAGLHTRCPKCSAGVLVPDASARGGEVAVTVRPEAPAPRDAWEPPPRARADEYRPPPSDYGPPRRDNADPSWQTVRMGLHLEFIAVIILVCVYAASLLIQCVSLSSAPGFGRGGGQALSMLMVGVGIVMLVGAATSLILIIVGRCMCCLAPPFSGTKGLAISSIACQALGLLLILAIFMVGFADRFGRRSEKLALGLVLAAAVALVAAHILFLLFLRGVAAYFGNDSLAARLIVYLVVSIVLPAVFVVGIIVLGMSRMGPGGGMGLLVVITLVQAVVFLGMLGWYSSLIAQVRDTIGKRPTDWRDNFRA